MLTHNIIILVTKILFLDVGMEKETRIGMEGICITYSCIPLYTVYLRHFIISHCGGMQEWVIRIPSIPNVSVLFPSLHLD